MHDLNQTRSSRPHVSTATKLASAHKITLLAAARTLPSNHGMVAAPNDLASELVTPAHVGPAYPACLASPKSAALLSVRPLGPYRPPVMLPATPVLSVRDRVAAYVALTKPRIIELLLITTVPTMIVADRGLPSPWLILATLLGGALAAAGANAINMYVDRDIDKLMKRTRKRPLVTGAIKPRNALIFAILLEIAAALELATLVNPLSAVLAISATLFYVFVYTLWLKRSSTQNIVIGGAAGAVPVLVGWAAVTNSLGLAPIVLFGVIFWWTPPHFWALAIRYREDYAAADVPMLPVVVSLTATARRIVGYTLVLWATTLLFWPIGDMGGIYAVAALALGAVFTYYAVQLVKNATPERAMRLFGYSITYVTLLFGAMAVDQLVRG
jgi:protoheme IX farnesyltransferase